MVYQPQSHFVQQLDKAKRGYRGGEGADSRVPEARDLGPALLRRDEPALPFAVCLAGPLCRGSTLAESGRQGLSRPGGGRA